MIGANFTARAHSVPSVFGHKGSSAFPTSVADIVCLLNSSESRFILQSLNPGVGFEVGDVNRLAVFHIGGSDEIFSNIKSAFDTHESHREPSVEFRCPGPSAWRSAQDWAQLAVDRPEAAPLPSYVPKYDAELPSYHLSYTLGVALGRFGSNGEGILDPSKDDLSHALPHGILFLDTTLDSEDRRDGLGEAAAAPLLAAWETYGPQIGTRRKSLREWLAWDFFKDVHKGMYENRPIHWPLSSANKTFVAWVNIHRLNDRTLRNLLADHLSDAMRRLEGTLNDLREARSGADQKAARAAEGQYDRVLKARDELAAFMDAVEQCASKGPPPTDAACPPREQNGVYAPDLDDGVMINSAALWPLLEPQWKDPKKWWKELAAAQGKKDYDWSHLAMRYWPTRVDRKCQEDPSLAVAHGCFWRYHPERAWKWELRLQDEIGPDFRIEEAPYCPGGRDLGDSGDVPHRAGWIREHPLEALAAVEREALRRMRRGKGRRQLPAMTILEPGLWSVLPGDVWEMELRLSEVQGCEFRLLAPDEVEARAAYAAAHPERVEARAELIANLVPPPGWFDAGSADEDEDGSGGEDPMDAAEEEEEA